MKWVMWPGEFALPSHSTYEEQTQLVREYQSKWRDQSVDWDALEQLLQRGESDITIFDAELAIEEHEFAVKLVGYLDDDICHVLFLHAESMEITDSRGRLYDLQQFLRLGQEYWEDFGK